jgi:mannosyltransferase
VRRHEWWILGGLIVVGAIVRFATLDLQSFHHDEAVTAGSVIQPGLGDTLGEVVDGERSPPLYYVLSWLWSRPFGTGEVGLRSFSALLGTLMIPAAFAAARELLSVRAGLLAAALVALNPLLVWYSQEARSYVLMALLVTVSLAVFVRLERRPDRRELTLWALACALALCSHYFAIFLVAPQVAWRVYRAPRSSPTLAAAGAVALAAIALIPLALIQQGEDRRDGFTELSISDRVAEVGLDYSASEEPDRLVGSARVDAVQLVAGVGGGLLVLTGVGLALSLPPGQRAPKSKKRSVVDRNPSVAVAVVAAAGIGVPALAALVGIDFFKPRNVMAGVVPLLLLAAVGFASTRAARIGLAAAGALCAIYAGVVVAVGSTAEMQRPDWRGAAEEIGHPEDVRLLGIPQNGDNPFLYYLGAERFLGPEGRAGAAVDEVVAVSTTGAIRTPPGFREVSRTLLPPLFEVAFLSADRPMRVTEPEVEAILNERSVALLQEP